MNLTNTLRYSHQKVSGLAEHAEAAGAAVVGVSVVAALAGLQGLAHWLRNSSAWVLYILAAKPLIDLSWRWEFMEIVNQRINPQAILAGIVILLNGIVVAFGFRKPRYFGRVLLFCGFATLSVALTPTSWGVNELIRLFAGVSFFFSAGIALREKTAFDCFCVVFLVVLCVPLTLSLLQVAGVLPFEYWDWLENTAVGRASGTYQHPLEVVFFLMYAIPVGLYRWDQLGGAAAERAFLIVFFVLAFLGLVFTFHRTGWIAISLEIALWLALKKSVKKIFLSALALGVLAFAFSEGVSLLYRPVTEIAQGQVDFASGEFLRGRGVNWIYFLTSYANGGPVGWVLGRGGSVADASVIPLSDFAENEPHNDFIRVLHAYGLVGLFLYLSLQVSFFRQGLRLQSSNVPFHSGVGRILLCSLAGVFLLSVTAEPMRYPTSIWYLFAFGSVVMFLETDLKTVPVKKRAG